MMAPAQVFPQIHEFSNGYWICEGVFVEPDDSVSNPMINEHLYVHLQERYYRNKSVPIYMKGTESDYHFIVHPDEGTPFDTIRMPFEMVDDMDIGRPPTEVQLLVAKPDHAFNISSIQRTQYV